MSQMLVDRSVRDLLSSFSSSDPTPGGGSASALASAVGVSLLIMVAGLPKTRNGSDEDRQALDGARPALDGLWQALVDAVDADTKAYGDVVAAYKLPKATADEQAARRDAIQRALKAATDVPLGVVRASADALALARTVETHGNRNAASDVGVAIALLEAGAHGARLNVEMNLGSVTDGEYSGRVRADLERLLVQ